MESFTLLLQSDNTNNVSPNDTTITTLSIYNFNYSVNWDAIIPPKYRHRKFKLSFSFVSNIYSTQTYILNDLMLLSVNFNGHSNNYDQSSQNSNILGFLNRVIPAVGLGYYMGDTKTNFPTICSYPSSNNINVKFYLNANYNTTPTVATFTEYSLFLNFELLPEH